MCTAITFQTKDHYFGRNLDFEYNYQETVTITPRNYPLPFRCLPTISKHYALIGMATVDCNYPLYYDATNEKGLSMAGLYFPDNAVYQPMRKNMDNITPSELIPWILCQCENTVQVKTLLNRTNLADIPYSDSYPQSPLHWMVSDRESSIVIEPRENGLNIFDNPVGVLTNNPPFEYHIHNLSNYLNLTSEEATNRFAPDYKIEAYSRGMGGIGLPGDLSSASRFIRATFTKLNSVCDSTEASSVSQFFHILGAVSQQRGCVKIGNDYEKTIYTSCCNIDKGIYYYTTYENHQITAVQLKKADLESDALTSFPLITNQQILWQN